ncbi:chromosomal replication initiator protein DnaA [Haloferula sp. A504]|uniref:chromosomal replication initiator protein DnaA n=1 Tax=Haloferula sp. A504 TaxID=3373601 RepID=UPI0031C74C96|nr:chromosomal replication initiator protein DnaA [Verrucomicrobiaceae bacterium E54]
MEREEATAGLDYGNNRAREEEVWSKVCEHLRGLVSGDAYDRWFRASRLSAVNDRHVEVSVPNEIHQVWIETNYLNELTAAVRNVIPEIAQVRLEVHDGQPGNGAEVAMEKDADNWFEASEPISDEAEALDRRLKRVGLNPSFGFESFVVGVNSQFAHAACEAVALGRGTGYNPLFIHGGPGLGKTHLMQAIGQEWLRRNPRAKIVYLTCERFINEFIDVVRTGGLEKFRRRYRTADLMLIDDVQFLSGKERSQEEFFHTFNTLLDGRGQVVLTSDRPASEIQSLEPRLVSRFECGLTVELQPPGFETRLAILQHKVREWKLQLDEGIVRMLAERIRTNVRRLEGGLMRVGTYSSLAGERVTPDKVEHLLRDLFREENGKQVSIDAIQRMVAERFDMRLADMASRRRPASIAGPRQIAMYLSRRLTKSSLMEIGEAFGGRDHGTVIHAVRKVTERIETDIEIRSQVAQIEAELRR